MTLAGMAGQPVVRVGVLGPVEVTVDGKALPIGGPKQRSVLALLILERNHVVPAARLVDAVWGEEARDGAGSTLQVYVSNLRKALEPASAALDTGLISTQRPGYVANVPHGVADLDVLDDHVAAGRTAASRGDAARAAHRFSQARALWRGEPLGGIDNEWFPQGLRSQLAERQLECAAEHLEAELVLGHHAQVLGELEGLVGAHPLDERFRGLLMLALYRTGRQADALTTYQLGRDALLDQLGLDPGPQLRELESKILNHDPSLERPTLGPAAVGEHHLELGTVLRSSLAAATAHLVVGDRTIPLRRPVTTIGRRSDRDVVIDDTKASRVHAEIRFVGNSFTIVDGGSANGTLVNGEPVLEHTLAPGDVVVVGDTEVRFEA